MVVLAAAALLLRVRSRGTLARLKAVADIYTTKVPLLKGGFWKMAHEARTDYAMLLGSLFLLIAGAGLWSLDARQRSKKAKAPEA